MSKRRCISIKEKLKVLEDVDSGIKKKDVAIKYGIPANSLSTIIKNRESIFKQSEVLADCNAARKRIKSCLYEDVDEALLKWISLVRDKNVPLSGTIIKEKAIEYAKSLGHTEFNASNGWLDKFKNRRRILKKIINAIDNNQPVIESINLRDCISELSKAWHDVNETTIKNCFSKAGFKNTPSASDCEEELPLSELKETWGKLKEYGTICDDAKLEEYLEIDNNMCIAELPNDDDILESVRNNEVEEVDDEENEEVENECVLKPSHNDMIKAFETIRHGFQFQENVPDDIFNSLHRCESFFEKNESASKVQQKITDYFSA